MECSATVRSSQGRHEAMVATAGLSQAIAIGPKSTGPGSAASGGELLLLALATCYCNDLYREAARLGIPLDGVEVTATATFAGVGLAARDIRYSAQVQSPAPADVIAGLLHITDQVAEVHNTLRAGTPVALCIGPDGGCV